MRFLLDTNTVSFLLRNQGMVRTHLEQYSPQDIAISSITEAELLYGIAKNPQPQLINAVSSFLQTVHVLAWDRHAAKHYGTLKASMINHGLSMAELDLQIVSHALSLNLTLVTSDHGILQLQKMPQLPLKLADWRQ